MKPRDAYNVPEDKQAALRRAEMLEWVTIAVLVLTALLMYLTMGASQAMKTAWVEDVLSLTPPISFLVALRIRRRKPDARHPYGYRRAMSLSFLVAAAAVVVVGLYVLYGAISALVKMEHPTIGHYGYFISLFGWRVWAGWVMMVALAISVVGPVILGRLKLPLSNELHEKTLHADATMNKADWMTGGAAMLGVAGIGLGWWWADAAAATVISLDVIKDGVTNTRRAMGNLLDQRPGAVSDEHPLDVGDRVRALLLTQPGVRDAIVRLREDGDTFSGELFVVFGGPMDAHTARMLAERAGALDSRLHQLVVMPVTPSDETTQPPDSD